MKINQLKLLSIAICCLVSVLWSETQGMEKEKNDEPIRNHQQEEFVPAGSIISFAGEVAPSGWLLCDGQKCYSREYPKLYEVIKTKYVPASEKLEFLEHNENNDNKKFRVPDLKGRVIVGVDGGAGRVNFNNYLGASGGEERHQLTEAELAVHYHNMQYSKSSTSGGQYPYFMSTIPGSEQPEDKVGRTIGAGGNQPHNNMQPYLVLNYIINTGREGNRQSSENIEDLKIQLDAIRIAHQDKLISFDTLTPDVNNAIYTLSRCLHHIMHHNFGWRSNSICFYDEVLNIQTTAAKYMNPK